MMGFFAAYGIIAVIAFAISVILGAISLFVGHIILFDSIILALISGVVCSQLWGIHPALCLVIGIAVFLFFFWLHHTKAGFWIIGTLMSAVWALVFSLFAYAISNGDMIWLFVIMGLGFILVMRLHLKARNDCP